MKKIKKLGQVALLAVVAVALSITACKQAPRGGGSASAVNFSVDGGNGTLKATVNGREISTGTNIPHDTEVVFTATPNEGFVVGSWSGGVVITSDNTATLEVTSVATVTVKFRKPKYKKIESGEGFEFTGTDAPNFKMKKIAAVTDGTIGRDDQDDNKPHQVSLSEYYLGETEVTQELYQEIMGNNPSDFKDNPASGEVQEKRPVEKVTWYEAVAFCNELTKVVADLEVIQCVYYSDEDKKTVYTKEDATSEKLAYMDMGKKGFRLPTEAEWEWAAQGGSARQKYAGTSDESKLGEYAWYSVNAGSKTHEVGRGKVNSFGYDMSGNVMEWCWDWYSDSTPTGGDNPTGSASGSYRVSRGGSWLTSASSCVVGYRDYGNPGKGYGSRGFRLAWRP